MRSQGAVVARSIFNFAPAVPTPLPTSVSERGAEWSAKFAGHRPLGFAARAAVRSTSGIVGPYNIRVCSPASRRSAHAPPAAAGFDLDAGSAHAHAHVWLFVRRTPSSILAALNGRRRRLVVVFGASDVRVSILAALNARRRARPVSGTAAPSRSFNPRRLQRAATRIQPLPMSLQTGSLFQSSPPARGRRRSPDARPIALRVVFQSSPPSNGRRRIVIRTSANVDSQFRSSPPSTGGDAGRATRVRRTRPCFNPRRPSTGGERARDRDRHVRLDVVFNPRRPQRAATHWSGGGHSGPPW